MSTNPLSRRAFFALFPALLLGSAWRSPTSAPLARPIALPPSHANLIPTTSYSNAPAHLDASPISDYDSLFTRLPT